jgi:hypothetical protein
MDLTSFGILRNFAKPRSVRCVLRYGDRRAQYHGPFGCCGLSHIVHLFEIEDSYPKSSSAMS